MDPIAPENLPPDPRRRAEVLAFLVNSTDHMVMRDSDPNGDQYAPMIETDIMALDHNLIVEALRLYALS